MKIHAVTPARTVTSRYSFKYYYPAVRWYLGVMRYAVLVVVIAACSKHDTAKSGAGTAGCVDVLACYRACPQLAADCTARCDALGTAEARAANLALIRCFGANNCQDESCMTTNCAAQFQACVGAVAAPAASAPAAPTAPANAGSPAGVSDNDFQFVGEDGLTYVPELTIVAHGVPLGLAGVWRESKRNVTFEIAGGGTYTLRLDEAVPGTGAVTHTETGEWRIDGSSLVVTPKQVGLTGLDVIHQEHDEVTPDVPRTWSIEGVTLEWTTMGTVHEVRHADGLVLSGPTPSWTSGPWNWTLRRAK